ncbi:MAG: DUF2721 domain-containing protein [Saprospiraceae bacterium]|uniref:DUF2721 domain-containing protein n=1 Tax=Candidatus Opimibacter skivensis TaxID=2982028 RepID=A0A9D7T0Z8_9BACT|nr:DUF2721 domain-containing protein [Candidatus Opimibacter skivensis]
MSTMPETINDISGAIQLALGPVFLLTGIAGMLNVMSGRLSRIIDRGRALMENPVVIATYDPAGMHTEMNMLERRRHITSIAITMCTVAALMVCLVIVSLFLEVMFTIPLNWFIGALFILATLSLVIGLSYFLREVHLSSISVRIKR